MSDNIDKLVGIGTAIKLKGKEYKMSPLTIADFGEISAYTKANRLKICMMANPEMTLTEKMQVIEERPSEKEIDTMLSDIAGLTFQAWLLIRHNHEITLKAVSELIDADNYKQVYEAIAQVNAVPNVEGQAKVTP